MPSGRHFALVVCDPEVTQGVGQRAESSGRNSACQCNAGGSLVARMLSSSTSSSEVNTAASQGVDAIAVCLRVNRASILVPLRPVGPGACAGFGTDRTVSTVASECEGFHTVGRVGDGDWWERPERETESELGGVRIDFAGRLSSRELGRGRPR